MLRLTFEEAFSSMDFEVLREGPRYVGHQFAPLKSIANDRLLPTKYCTLDCLRNLEKCKEDWT